MIKLKELIPKTIIKITTPFMILDGEPKSGVFDSKIKTIEPYFQGKQFLTFYNNHFKITSNAPTINTNYKENEPKLNNDEEFVIVNKIKVK